MPENWRLVAIDNIDKQKYDENYDRIFGNKEDVKSNKKRKRGNRKSPK